MIGVVPFLTSFVDRKCLLLGVHVQQQVGNTVAVAELVIIPGERVRKRNELFGQLFGLFMVFLPALDMGQTKMFEN